MRSVPGPWRRMASKRRSVSLPAFALSSPIRSVQAAFGSSVSSRQMCATASQSFSKASSPLEVRVHGLRPGRGRAGNERPVRRALVDDLAGLRQIREQVVSRAAGIEACERSWRMRARERDARGMLVGEVAQAVEEPGRDELEGVLLGVRDPLALHPLVEVEDVHEAGAAEVRGVRDLARESFLPDVARHRDVLPLLHVRAEHGELRKAVEPFLRALQLAVGHARTLAWQQCARASERVPRACRGCLEAACRRADPRRARGRERRARRAAHTRAVRGRRRGRRKPRRGAGARVRPPAQARGSRDDGERPARPPDRRRPGRAPGPRRPRRPAGRGHDRCPAADERRAARAPARASALRRREGLRGARGGVSRARRARGAPGRRRARGRDDGAGRGTDTDDRCRARASSS